MKQILQSLDHGATCIIEAPAPIIVPGHLLIHSTVSLISVGTERILVGFGKASYIEKARQQHEKVKMVWGKVKTDGLLATIDSVRAKLAQPLTLGYCNVGIVTGIGSECGGFELGSRIVSNGAHADVVRVAKNICARIPDNVDDESAAF